MVKVDGGVPLEELLFFDRKEEVLPLYLTLRQRILHQLGASWVLVQKSQITFRSPYPFCWISRPQGGSARRQRAACFVVSFCLGVPVEDSRIRQLVEPYSGRFMHHVMLSCPDQVDDQLLSWIAASQAFRNEKQAR